MLETFKIHSKLDLTSSDPLQRLMLDIITEISDGKYKNELRSGNLSVYISKKCLEKLWSVPIILCAYYKKHERVKDDEYIICDKNIDIEHYFTLKDRNKKLNRIIEKVN